MPFGKSFHLVANFLKRHFNLRCIVKQLYGDMRVFPERYVVCVSCPEDTSAHHGNPSLAATELSEQSHSEYFSRVGETLEPSNIPTKTKKTVLQKIAKQAGVQRELHASSAGGGQQVDQGDCPQNPRGEIKAGDSESSPKETSCGQKTLPEADHMVPCPSALNEAEAQIGTTQDRGLTQDQQTGNSPPDGINPTGASEISQETRKSKRSKPSDSGEDPHPQRAKRTCLERPPATTPHECSTQTSRHDLPPLLPPLPPAEANAESKAFPVSGRTKTTVEVELLTPGKRAQRPPLTSNNTAQTNQNRLAASLRGLSVKPASSCSSISSRSTLAAEGNENVPRTSRLRRLKRS
ncbi:protein SLX4IP isoform X2 [Trematomus bernacchii]|uniref:protein SLX4IP isoform X2 n=1 Tax=Trematomus bernacchii TaxID=40690 RepID=UPI00146D7FAA|nr:protein SLX4IP isoform X2 [Trematomus bernacchii]